MHFLRALAEGHPPKWAHERFTRYGRGSFPGPRATLKKTGDKLKVSGTVDYATLYGLLLVDPAYEYSVSGKIFVRRDVADELSAAGIDPKKSKKKGEMRTITVKETLPGQRLKTLYEALPDAIFLVDVKATGKSPFAIKCKKSLPKPGSEPDPKTCVATLPAERLGDVLESVYFDLESQDATEASLATTYDIEGLVADDAVRNDPKRYRLEAKRTGTMTRRLTSGGADTVNNYGLLV